MYGQPYYGPPPNWPPQQMPPQWGPATQVVWVPTPPGTDVDKVMKLLDKIERRRVRKEEEKKKDEESKKKKEDPKKLKDTKFSILEVVGLVFIGYLVLAPTFKGLQIFLP